MRDGGGAAIAIFTASKHMPTETSHQITLQGVVYQLDVALERFVILNFCLLLCYLIASIIFIQYGTVYPECNFQLTNLGNLSSKKFLRWYWPS